MKVRLTPGCPNLCPKSFLEEEVELEVLPDGTSQYTYKCGECGLESLHTRDKELTEKLTT